MRRFDKSRSRKCESNINCKGGVEYFAWAESVWVRHFLDFLVRVLFFRWFHRRYIMMNFDLIQWRYHFTCYRIDFYGGTYVMLCCQLVFYFLIKLWCIVEPVILSFQIDRESIKKQFECNSHSSHARTCESTFVIGAIVLNGNQSFF